MIRRLLSLIDPRKIGQATMFTLTMIMMSQMLAFAPYHAVAADRVGLFSQQENSRERVRILRNLADHRQLIGEKNAKALVEMGLIDEKPNVVEAAAHQIGRMKLVELEDQLIQTYITARKKHRGYGERVRLSCLRSLGKIGGPKTAQLLSDALSRDHGTVLGGVMLQIARQLKDPSLIEDLEAYADKMAVQIREGKLANDNPMLYSNAQRHMAHAQETIEILNKIKGGQR